jgi:hypothetical protein
MNLFCFSLLMLILVAVVMEILIIEIIEIMIAFLESFSIYEDILKNLFNSKYRSITSNIQSEIFNNSDVSASIFIIAEL